MSRQTKAAPVVSLSTLGSKGASRITTHSDLAFSTVSVSIVLTVQLCGPIHEALRLSSVFADSLCRYFVAGSVNGAGWSGSVSVSLISLDVSFASTFSSSSCKILAGLLLLAFPLP